MENTSFTWFAEFRERLEDLDDVDSDAMILAVVKYGMYGVLPDFTGPLMSLFKSFAQDVDYSKKKRSSGGRGGRPKGSRNDAGNLPENLGKNLPGNQSADVVKTTKNEPENLGKNLGKNPEQNSTEQNSAELNTPPYPPKGKVGVGFERPSVKDVSDHISKMGYHFDAEEFVAFYDSKGWKVGNQPMVDWESACVSWEARRTGHGTGGKGEPDLPPAIRSCPTCGETSWPIGGGRHECPKCGEWSE